MKTAMNALIAVLLVGFTLSPLATMRYGDNPYGPLIQLDHTLDQGRLLHPYFTAIEFHVGAIHQHQFDKIAVRIDSAPVAFRHEITRVDYGTATLTALPSDERGFPQGKWIEVEAPFTIHFRPLYSPSLGEMLWRLTLWPPTILAVLFVPCLFFLAFLSLIAISKIQPSSAAGPAQ